VRPKLVEFLKICDEGGFRPFHHHVGLAPDRYRRLMDTVYGRAQGNAITSTTPRGSSWSSTPT